MKKTRLLNALVASCFILQAAPAKSAPPSSPATSATASKPATQPVDPIVRVRQVEPLLLSGFAAAKQTVATLIPDAVKYEASLPARAKVLETKDQLNFRNYAGLAEAYLMEGKIDKAVEIFDWCKTNYVAVLGKEDHFVVGMVGGDFGLYYYNNGDLAKANQYCRDAAETLATYGPPASMNNLIADYAVLTLIADKGKKDDEAKGWAKKLIDLSVEQHRPRQPATPPEGQ